MRELFASAAARRFVVVGGLGFMVDAAVLTALTALAGWNALRARVLSFVCAVTATWLANRLYTFAGRRRYRLHVEYSRYVLVQCLGAALNFAVFAVAIDWSPLLKAYPVLPLAVGSGCAMFFNYWALQGFVFPNES